MTNFAADFMEPQIAYLIWNADPELFSWEIISPRWYGLLFALGFILSQQILYYMHKKEGKPVQDVDTLTVYMVIATIIGARLGHVFFYEPDKYLADPIQIFMITKGGLASHGAAVGILFALWLYSKYDIKFKGLKLTSKKVNRPGQSYLEVLDRIVILIAMTGALIRVGNFINSEIEGKPTGSSTGVFFARTVTDRLANDNSAIAEVSYAEGDGEVTDDGHSPVKINVVFKDGYDEATINNYMNLRVKNLLVSDYYIKKYVYEEEHVPLNYKIINDNGKWHGIIYSHAIIRYPSQLIEASGYLLIFILLFLIWNKYKEKLPKGRIFGLFLITLFGLRIVFEFIKENQVDFENELPFNMGQLLSVPLVIAGIIILVMSFRKSNHLASNGAEVEESK